MSKALSAFVVLLVVSASAAAPPELSIPAEVKPANGYATVRPKTDAKAVSYVGLSGVYPFPSELLADKRMFVLPSQGLPAGRYRFVAVGSLNDEHAVVEFAVVVGEPGPGPGPTPPPPPPGPDPPPGPVTPSELWVVLIEETGAAARTRLGWLSNPTLTAAMKRAGNHYRIVDKDVVGADGKPPSDVLPYLAGARIAGVPQVYLVDATGKTRWSGKVPATPEELAKLIDQYGGNK